MLIGSGGTFGFDRDRRRVKHTFSRTTDGGAAISTEAEMIVILV
jgi:hypothetical protein